MSARGKRLALPVRRSMNLTEAAYERLRALNAQYGLENNYLLVVLLENLDAISEPEKLDRAFRSFIAEYGPPDPAKPMESR
jgi:hypothetical protein